MFAQWAEGMGMPVPEEPDQVYPELIPVWIAFHILSARRPSGFVAGPIPWSEASRYCKDHGVRGERRLRWIRLIGAMDAVYLSNSAAERKRLEATRGNA